MQRCALRRLAQAVAARSHGRNHTLRRRHLACAAQASMPHNAPEKRSAADIMDMSSNKATRFVYMRTLPLVKQPELADDVDAIAASIETSTKALCERHSTSLADDRAAVHLHTAALAIATHRVLSPRIKNEIRLSNIIRAGFGASLLPEPTDAGSDVAGQKAAEKLRPDFWIVRAALWFAFDKMRAVRSMTANMVRDFGASFETEARDSEADGQPQHTLLVTKCYYNTICREEGLPHLTKVFCALDRAIYSPITEKSHGIEFSLDKTLADDAGEEDNSSPACEFKFTKKRR